MMVAWYWLLALMILCHILEDFHLQGLLGDLKQRMWWRENVAPKDLKLRYRYDYIVALLAHGFEWSMFINAPLVLRFGLTPGLMMSVVINALVHANIDHMKCNLYRINLLQDQILHIAQICLTLAVFMGVFVGLGI